MEVCFRLPEDNEHAQKFQQLFAALEFSYRDMGISSYGISDTNLEEVRGLLLFLVISPFVSLYSGWQGMQYLKAPCMFLCFIFILL